MSSVYEKEQNTLGLLKAVDHQPLQELQAILKDIIDQSPEGREIASKWLFPEEKDVQPEPEIPSTYDTPIPVVPLSDETCEWRSLANTRAPVSQDICIYCREPFDVTRNSRTSCKYHVFPDMINHEFLYVETEAEASFDNDEFRQAFPENFTYACCGSDLTGKQCQVGWHRVADPTERLPKLTLKKEFRPV
ncbi:hypothetical protein N7457_000401 [Penicillium paradoxum]|uniref:uncharacterized protein n=1 Tax=Penicillium paradoxum TaxID=176176 RepID=UPI0025471F92|nr:uncharacterized protein N7457_000401 [Penicillium paradoxum]KAJ5793802.1 hypothetical protein N7457_000401 [Penicillium paradoxum]